MPKQKPFDYLADIGGKGKTPGKGKRHKVGRRKRATKMYFHAPVKRAGGHKKARKR